MQSKSGFIRDLLAQNKSPAEIVEAGKKAKMPFKVDLVYQVRSRAPKSSGIPRPAVHSSNALGSGSDFVRSCPDDWTAARVVAAAKEKGLKFSTNLVYAVRAAKKGPPRGQLPKQSVLRPQGQENEFCRLIVQLGVGRAQELLRDLEDRLSKIIAGGLADAVAE